jgi:hypothetical protein
MAGINKTPDIRTRAMLPEWAAWVSFTYVTKLLTERSVVHLFGAAGVLRGLGDNRKEKGGTNGCFQIVDENNANFQRIIKTQDKGPQDEALEKATPVDFESEELLSWFRGAMIVREKTEETPAIVGGRNGGRVSKRVSVKG